jgi:hypothetical protein
MSAKTEAQNISQLRNAPRRKRGAAAVIAQYIQDLTHPREPMPCQ